MENRFSLFRIWRIASMELYKWIINPRMIVIFVMLIFIWNFSVTPLINLSNEINSPLNAVEPFIAVCNSRALCLVIPAIYLFLISDHPKIDSNGLFILYRVRKREWILGQFIFFVISALLFIGIIFLFTLIINFKNSFLANGWSLVVTRYSIYYPEKSSSFAANLINKELYTQISPYQVAVSSFFLTFLYMLLISMILLFFNTFNLKQIGIPFAVCIIALGSAMGFFKSNGMWWFPMAHTMVELHYIKYLKKPIISLTVSYMYFLSNILFILGICAFKAKNTDFLSNEEK